MKIIGTRGMLGLGGLLVVLGAIVAALAQGDIVHRDVSEPAPKRVLVVTTQAAREQATYAIRRSFVGRVEARRSTDVGFELGGAVLRIVVDEGDSVEPGQLLARLDTKRLAAKRAEQKARLHEAEARLSLIASTRERTLEALELNAVSTQQWDEADRGLAAQEAVVRRVAAQIESIDVDVEKARLRAPFAGVIARRFVDEGTVVSPGEPLFRVLEIGHPEIRVGISAELAPSLSIGEERIVRANGRELTATIRALLPARNRETRTVDVVLTLPAKAAGLRDGDLVAVELSQTVASGGFWLPRSALTESARGLWASYVAEPVGAGDVHVLARRELELIHVDGDSVFVRGTLNDGELVVTDGLQRLVPNQRVALARENDR
jgi:RND family efflux transporter MFP subunit